MPDGTVYSKRKNLLPFSSPPLSSYARLLGDERIERLKRTADPLKGLKLLELNATAQGGGVAEMLYSAVPFMSSLGLDVEWKTIKGNKEYFECTKTMHNLLQGMGGSFTRQMEQIYLSNLEVCAKDSLIDYRPDVITVHDPQPLCLVHSLKRPEEIWLWRCHIDIEEAALKDSSGVIPLLTDCIEHYDAAIFSAAHYVVSHWPLPKFIIPPCIDPLSEKNKDLKQEEIDSVLTRYSIDSRVPIILQVGRFDPWKGIDRTVSTYREVKKEKKCQLVIAGGMASDDPEGERVLNRLINETRIDKDIHVLNLPVSSNLEINALQRAASVIMQPSTKEGFGLVITEGLWKAKPVIASDVGGIPIQLRDGDTGYYYQNPRDTAQTIIYLFENPEAAFEIGNRGKEYVREHFLLPDRIADYLMAIQVIKNMSHEKKLPPESIISFHPWVKLSKRKAKMS